jgi:hypothetical protein
MQALKIDGTVRDRSGYAPGRVSSCDATDCATCDQLGWILCDHAGTGRETPQGYCTCDDGVQCFCFVEWCSRCDAPADKHPAWTWCPARKN